VSKEHFLGIGDRNTGAINERKRKIWAKRKEDRTYLKKPHTKAAGRGEKTIRGGSRAPVTRVQGHYPMRGQRKKGAGILGPIHKKA